MLDIQIIKNFAKAAAIRSPETVDKKTQDCQVDVWNSIDSTNTRAMQLARSGAEDGTAVIAETQTHGRGRMGRTFFSPDGTGLYLSIIVRKPFDVLGVTGDRPGLLTALAGTVAANVIAELTGVDIRLKWVNDLYIGEKKVGGILTEGSFSGDRLDFAVIGIGINVFPPRGGFPAELENIAATLISEGETNNGLSPVWASLHNLRERLAGRIIAGIRGGVDEIASDPTGAQKKLFNSYYERFKWMIGRTIGVINPASGKMIPAIVRGLTKNFELTVSYESKNSCSNTASKEYGANSGVINLRSGEAVFLNPQFPLV